MDVVVAVLARNLCKSYEIGEARLEVLRNVNMSVFEEKFVAICGVLAQEKLHC